MPESKQPNNAHDAANASVSLTRSTTEGFLMLEGVPLDSSLNKLLRAVSTRAYALAQHDKLRFLIPNGLIRE